MSRDVRANPANRAGTYTETPEYVRFMRRVSRALGRRIEDLDPAALAELAALRDDMRQIERQAAVALNDQGFSWTEIGRPQRISASNACQKYARGFTDTSGTITWTRVAPGIYRAGDLRIERAASGLWDLTDAGAWVGDSARYRDAKEAAEEYIKTP
jgi:hypothetical protein